MRSNLSAAAIGLLLCSCHGGASPANPSPTGNGAMLFESGVVSSAAPEFATAFSPDGREVFFDRAFEDRVKLTIMMSTRRDGRWTAPVVAPFSGRYRDMDPFVAPDGKLLYFSSDRPRPGARAGGIHTWIVARTAAGWGEPVEAGAPLNSDSTDIFVSVSAHGEMLFTSNRSGTMRVYGSIHRDGKWQTPTPVAFGTATDAGNPLIAADGRLAVFVRALPGQKANLFYSCRIAGKWSDPRPLSDAVNTRYAEFAPGFGAGGRDLYFTSERPGVVAALPDSIRPPGDIYTRSACRGRGAVPVNSARERG